VHELLDLFRPIGERPGVGGVRLQLQPPLSLQLALLAVAAYLGGEAADVHWHEVFGAAAVVEGDGLEAVVEA
jgi:hypothetical protein